MTRPINFSTMVLLIVVMLASTTAAQDFVGRQLPGPSTRPSSPPSSQPSWQNRDQAASVSAVDPVVYYDEIQQGETGAAEFQDPAGAAVAEEPAPLKSEVVPFFGEDFGQGPILSNGSSYNHTPPHYNPIHYNPMFNSIGSPGANTCWGPGDFFGGRRLQGPGCRFPGLWVRGEYLLWWVDGFDVPPLVTSSPATTIQTDAGVLGETTTDILVGDTSLGGGAQSGGRISFGYWFDPAKTAGLEANYMKLGGDSFRFYQSSAGGIADTILGRPFTNVESGFQGEDAKLIAFPSLLAGNVQVRGETSLQGAEVLFRHAVTRRHNYRIDFLAGWRFNRLDDELMVRDFRRSLGLGSGLAIGTTVDTLDRFETRNWFNGAEIGVGAEIRRCPWTLGATMKLALGNTHGEVIIDGTTTTTVPLPGGGTDVAVTQAGFLALGTNIGTYENDALSLIPELGVTLGYDLTPCLRATFGYSFIYWSRVARPGDQIDLDLNLTQLELGGLVGNPRPEFTWVNDDVWMQGMNFGLDYRF